MLRAIHTSKFSEYLFLSGDILRTILRGAPRHLLHLAYFEGLDKSSGSASGPAITFKPILVETIFVNKDPCLDLLSTRKPSNMPYSFPSVTNSRDDLFNLINSL